MTSMTTFDGTAIAYNYSPTANDGKLVSQVTGSETVNYPYDVLGRLSQAATAGAGGWGMSWTYDGWGNRLQQSAVKGSVPTMVSITEPATNRIQAHTYDANGNTVNTPQQGAMTYDVINRLKTVASDTYGYDPSNKRIWRNDEYIFWGAGGERIGRYSAVQLVNEAGAHVVVFQKVQVDEYFGGRRLTSQDRLGSVGSYYPYGEAKSGTVSNADSFATYYRDSTGLDYANQRHYAAGVGRFIPSKRRPSGAGELESLRLRSRRSHKFERSFGAAFGRSCPSYCRLPTVEADPVIFFVDRLRRLGHLLVPAKYSEGKASSRDVAAGRNEPMAGYAKATPGS